jgi:hypothetical protein
MKKDLASLLLAHPEDSSMRYLYECMYGRPMLGTAENPLPDNVVPFPMQASVSQRQRILQRRKILDELESE